MIRFSKIYIDLPLADSVTSREEVNVTLMVSGDRPEHVRWMASVDKGAHEHGDSAKWALVALAQKLEYMALAIKEFADSPEVAHVDSLNLRKEE